MINRNYHIKLLIITACILQIALASAPKVGTNGATELLIPMGAVNVALSGSNIANISGANAIYWNPAGLAIMNGGEATFSYLNYFAGMKVSYMAGGAKLGRLGVVGVSLQVLDIGEIPVTTIEAPEGTGEIIEPNYLTIGATYSRAFTDRINFGVNAKLISEKIGSMSASGIGFDLGLQYVSPWGIAFGVAMRNIGSKITFDGTGIEFDSVIPYSKQAATTRKTRLDMASSQLPTNLSLGLAYVLKLNDLLKLNLVGSYTNNSFTINQASAGVEATLMDMFVLRGGYQMTLFPEDYPEAAKEDNQYGMSLGGGCHMKVGNNKLMVDYAYRPMKTLEPNQYFSIGIAF
ncbi:MAG: PorV/PorQ family protein [Candidatus Marinimicrobia bacterium]|nr:PorV/PorQ family protein [Candidatus Neomarinimicrobiota bacterium]